MFRAMFAGVVACATVAFAGSANAVVVGEALPVIDSFDAPVYVAEGSRFASTTRTQSAPIGAIGDRRASVSSASGASSVLAIFAGMAEFRTLGNDAVFTLEYGVSSPLDLVLPGDAFKFSVFESDLDDRNVTAGFTTTLTSGDGIVESATIQLSGEGDYVIPFSLFDLTDFNDVDDISFVFDTRGLSGARMVIGEIVDPILPGAAALPEPATFTLLGFGVLGLFGAARHLRR